MRHGPGPGNPEPGAGDAGGRFPERPATSRFPVVAGFPADVLLHPTDDADVRTRPILLPLLLGWAALSAPSGYVDPSPPRSPHPPASPGTGGPATTGGFATIPAVLDSLARGAIESGRIPGLAVVLVRDGAVAWSRGYGRERLDGGRPVSPDATRFPVGSVSKVVTALLVLRLVEEGRLDLHADLRAYVPDSLPPPGPGGPLTLHDLLTHTAGLEPSSVGLAARHPDGLEPLEGVLARRMPRRVRPPGLVYLYSQFDFGLAGLAAQQAAGRPFARLARERVFAPLDMSSASFRPDALRHERTADGHVWTGDGLAPAPTVYHQIPPAGGLVATPLDLARLMVALLEPTGRSAPGLLRPESLRRMIARQWSPHPHPRVEGTAYGLFEYRACGIRALSTRGWVGGHSSYLHLIPDRGVGLLVAGNASSLGGLESELRLALHRRLPGSRCGTGDRPADRGPAGRRHGDGGAGERPSPAQDGPVPDGGPGISSEGGRMTGLYRSIGFRHRGVEALGRLLLAPTLAVRSGGEGPVLELGGRRVAAERVDSLLLRASRGAGREEFFSFVPGGPGDRGYLAWEGEIYEKILAFLDPALLRAAVGLAGLILLTGLAASLVRLAGGAGAFFRGRAPGRLDRATAWRLAGGLLSLLPLVFAVGMTLHLVPPARYEFAFGVPASARSLLWLPAAWTVLASAMGLVGGAMWWRDRGGAWERLHWAVVVATGLVTGGALVALGVSPP